MKNKSNSAGMSLVETIVALAIFGIMTLLAVSIFMFAGRQYRLAHEVDTNTDSEGALIEQGGPATKTELGNSMSFDINGIKFSVPGSLNTFGKNDDDEVVINYFIPKPNP